MTYSLKTSLYFIAGILGLGTAIILAATNPGFAFAGALAFLTLALITTGWFRVFHTLFSDTNPPKSLSLTLGITTLSVVFLMPIATVVFGLPLVLAYVSVTLAFLTAPPYMALGIRNDVISFYESRKREKDIEENTPHLSVPVNPKDVVSLPKEDYEEMLKPLKLDTLEQGITSRTLTAKDFDYTPQKHIFFGASPSRSSTPTPT